MHIEQPEVAPRDAYTHGHHESVLRIHSWRTVDNSAAYLAPHLREGAKVLDVGSGPGTISLDLARRVRPGTVVGVDASSEVVDRANGLARSEGVSNVEFRLGDAYALDFDDDMFDVVHAHQVLQHVSNPVALLRELRRVRKPGGVVAARDVDYGGCFWFPESDGLDRWVQLLSQVQRSNEGEPDAGRRLKAWAVDAGFSDVVATASVWCFNTETDREWWGSLWEARMLQSALAVDAIDMKFATQDELIDVSMAWRAWANDPLAWFAMPHGEILCRG